MVGRLDQKRDEKWVEVMGLHLECIFRGVPSQDCTSFFHLFHMRFGRSTFSPEIQKWCRVFRNKLDPDQRIQHCKTCRTCQLQSWCQN